MRRLLALFLSIALLTAVVAVAQDAPGSPKVGFVFIAKPASIREMPDSAAKEVGKGTVGSRVTFRRVLESGGKVAWYRVQPAGGAEGWVAAADVSDKRPGVLPPSKPIAVTDSGVGLAKAAGAQTAAARGLSKSATEYASNNPDFKKAADHFVTLEGFVEKQFDDKHLESGDYNDVDVPGRQAHADAFKAGVK